MKSILKCYKMVKKMGIFDVSLYKLMLIAVGILLYTHVAWFSSVNILLWIAVTAICLIPLTIKLYTPSKKAHGLIGTVMENFHHLKILDLALFEIGMVSVGMVLYHYIPFLASLPTTLRWVLALFGGGWMLSMVAHWK